MANEPSVKVSIIDDTLNLGNDPVDTSVNVLVPVISPSGRADCYQVSGPSEFKREYNNSNKITPNDHISMITARALSSHAPIWIKRVVRDNILAGRDCLNSRNVYVDKDTLSPISGAIANLSISKKSTVQDHVDNFESKIQSDILDGTRLGSYSISGSEIISTDKKPDSGTVSRSKYIVDNYKEFLGAAVTEYTKFPNSVLVFINNKIHNLEVTFNTSYSYTFLTEKDSDLSGLFDYIVENNIYPDHVIGTNIKYNIETHKISKLKDDDYAITGLVFNNNNVSIKVTPYITETTTNDGVKLGDPKDYIEYCYLLKSESDWSNNYPIEKLDLSFIFGTDDSSTTHRYIKGIDTSTETLDSNTIIHKIDDNIDGEYDILKYICNSLVSICGACTSGSNSFIVPGLTNAISGSESEMEINTEEINTTIDIASYAIVSLTPNTNNNINISVNIPDKTLPNIYHLTMTYGSISEDYDFSLIDGTVDGYGTDVSYTKINDNSKYIRIIKLDGDNVNNSYSFYIGSGVTNDYITEDSIGDALQSIIDEESNPVLFDYVSDAGVVGNSNITSAIKNCISEWKSFYVASCPTKMTKTNLESVAKSLGDTYTMCYPGYSAMTTDIDQGSVLMSGSYFYLARRLEISNSNLEYTSIFGDRGLLSITPFIKFKKADREELLDYRIPTLQPRITASGSLSYYQNLDCTLQSTTSYLQDVNIVLMTNKICQLAINYGKTLIGHNNTKQLRMNVETELNEWIKERVRVGTEYGPLSSTVLCNSITSQSLIDRGYVKIEIYASFTRAIQNVLVYTHVQSVTSDESSNNTI